MRIGICQTWMYPSIEENVENVLNWIKQCGQEGVELAIFPECGLIGFHRQLPQNLNYEILIESYERVLSCCHENGVSAIIGSAHLESTDTKIVFNSAIHFPTDFSEIAVTSKIGLADAEKLFFTAGKKRKIFNIKGYKIAVVFCIEINDAEEIIAEFKNSDIDALAWISYISWDNNDNPSYAIDDESSLRISKHLKVPILNANWANSVNEKTISGMGGSKIISNGELDYQSPYNKEDFKIIEI